MSSIRMKVAVGLTIALVAATVEIKPWWLMIDKDLRIGKSFPEALNWQLWRWSVKCKYRDYGLSRSGCFILSLLKGKAPLERS